MKALVRCCASTQQSHNTCSMSPFASPQNSHCAVSVYPVVALIFRSQLAPCWTTRKIPWSSLCIVLAECTLVIDQVPIPCFACCFLGGLPTPPQRGSQRRPLRCGCANVPNFPFHCHGSDIIASYQAFYFFFAYEPIVQKSFVTYCSQNEPIYVFELFRPKWT